MLNDKPNNMDWKNKLEEMESSPGEIFNKEASWDKLHIQLQPKQKKRKVIWYWLAAACLFFALFILFILSNKKENVLMKNTVLQNKIDSSYSNVPMINDDSSKIISSSSILNNKPSHFINNNDKTITAIHHKIIKQEIIHDKKDRESIITQEIDNNAVTPVATAINIVANLPEKKKLKVVHINELGEPVTEAPSMAHLYNRHSFQFKFMNQEGYTTSSNFSNNNKVLKNFTTINLPSN